MNVRTKAAFSTALRSKTSIWPGDLIRYDIGGAYIWRRGDTSLAKPSGNKYLVKNPGILSLYQVEDLARDTADLIGLMTGLPVIAVTGPDNIPAFQLGEQR